MVSLSPELSNIVMSGNYLMEITPDTFDGLKNLKELDVSFNDISLLIDQSFRHNPKLEIVKLSNNKISEISRENFRNLQKLTQLDLSRNSIQKIDSNSFDDLRNLEILYLYYNSLLSFSDLHPFKNNEKLRKIDVRYISLSDIWNLNIGHLKYLELLSAENNNLTELFIPKVLPGSKKIVIHLESNNIRLIHVDSNIQGDSDSREINSHVRPDAKIYLSNNPLRCDCHTYALYKILNGSNFLPNVEFVEGLSCQSPEENKGKQLSTLNPRDFTCIITENCPKMCSCVYRAHDNTQTVNCSNAHYYQTLPSRAPFNTGILFISENDLTSLLQLNETVWENLTEIHAQNNVIESEEFAIPTNLNFLDLKYNKLKTLPDTVKKHSEKAKGFKMAISGNPWPCDCSILPYKSWLSRYFRQVVDITDVRCVFPNNSLSTVSLTAMDDFELCPQLPTFVYITVAVLALLFMSLFVFYVKYKYHILSFLYTYCNCCFRMVCCGRQNDEDKPFDCFISYGSEDSDVTSAILEELEEKPPNFDFCIHERNWMPGRYITNNIVQSVQNSRKTLIILSKTFVKSQWFYMEFQAAYRQTLQDKKDRLIIVVKGDLPDKAELDEDVKFVISWKTYLVWGEKWFFEKLRYSIYEENTFTKRGGKCTLRNVLNCFKDVENLNEHYIPMNENVNRRNGEK